MKQQMTIHEAFGLACAYAARKTSEFKVVMDTEGNGFDILSGSGDKIASAYLFYFNESMVPEGEHYVPMIDTLDYF